MIVFVAVDDNGNPTPTKKWIPKTEREKNLESYAIKLNDLRAQIAEEMKPFIAADATE